jgi:uncharacterized membrane protein YkvA (DUF1232 family)
MALRTNGLVRSLGWGGIFRLLANLPNFFKLFHRLVKDSRVPASAKLLLVGVLGYLILPADLVPDFFPGLGQLDDLAVIFGGLKLFLRLCPPEVVQEHVRAIGAAQEIGDRGSRHK